MGFFSSLARKLIDKSDEEAVKTISKEQQRMPHRVTALPGAVTTDLPPPRRIDTATPTAEPIALPPNFPGPPNRVAMPPDLGPPPGQHEYDLDQMEAILRSHRTVPVAPAVPMPVRAEPVVTPEMAPPAPAEALPPPNRVMLGERYAGMSPTGRASAHLQTLSDASPMSKVKDTGSAYEILPPNRMSRGRGFLEGFRQTAGAGAQYGTGGIVGAGIIGGIRGLISPGSVQKHGRAMEIAGAENQLARAQGLEAQGLQNDARRIANTQNLAELGQMGDERNLKLSQEQRIEWQQGLANIGDMQKAQGVLDPKSQQYTDAQKAIEQEAERLSRRTGRKVSVIPGNPKLNQLPKLEVDGQIVQQQYDGSWRPVYGTSRSATTDEQKELQETYDWQVKNTENEGKRTAAMQSAAALEGAASDHQRKVASIAGQISEIDEQMAAMSKRDPALGPLQRQRQQLKEQQAAEQKKMDDAYRAANENKAEAAKYPTLPPPPKRAKRASASTPYTGRTMSTANLTRYAKDKGLTEAEARRQVEAQGVRVQ